MKGPSLSPQKCRDRCSPTERNECCTLPQDPLHAVVMHHTSITPPSSSYPLPIVPPFHPLPFPTVPPTPLLPLTCSWCSASTLSSTSERRDKARDTESFSSTLPTQRWRERVMFLLGSGVREGGQETGGCCGTVKPLITDQTTSVQWTAHLPTIDFIRAYEPLCLNLNNRHWSAPDVP